MPKRSSKPTRDENEAAFAAVRHIIQTTEETPADRVLALERLCREVLQFGERANLPARVISALRDAARGRPVAETLLPIVPSDLSHEPPAVMLGRAGGLKGGAARAASLTAKKRGEIARKAAAARWQKKTNSGN